MTARKVCCWIFLFPMLVFVTVFYSVFGFPIAVPLYWMTGDKTPMRSHFKIAPVILREMWPEFLREVDSQ